MGMILNRSVQMPNVESAPQNSGDPKNFGGTDSLSEFGSFSSQKSANAAKEVLGKENGPSVYDGPTSIGKRKESDTKLSKKSTTTRSSKKIQTIATSSLPAANSTSHTITRPAPTPTDILINKLDSLIIDCRDMDFRAVGYFSEDDFLETYFDEQDKVHKKKLILSDTKAFEKILPNLERLVDFQDEDTIPETKKTILSQIFGTKDSGGNALLFYPEIFDKALPLLFKIAEMKDDDDCDGAVSSLFKTIIQENNTLGKTPFSVAQNFKRFISFFDKLIPLEWDNTDSFRKKIQILDLVISTNEKIGQPCFFELESAQLIVPVLVKLFKTKSSEISDLLYVILKWLKTKDNLGNPPLHYLPIIKALFPLLKIMIPAIEAHQKQGYYLDAFKKFIFQQNKEFEIPLIDNQTNFKVILKEFFGIRDSDMLLDLLESLHKEGQPPRRFLVDLLAIRRQPIGEFILLDAIEKFHKTSTDKLIEGEICFDNFIKKIKTVNNLAPSLITNIITQSIDFLSKKYHSSLPAPNLATTIGPQDKLSDHDLILFEVITRVRPKSIADRLLKSPNSILLVPGFIKDYQNLLAILVRLHPQIFTEMLMDSDNPTRAPLILKMGLTPELNDLLLLLKETNNDCWKKLHDLVMLS